MKQLTEEELNQVSAGTPENEESTFVCPLASYIYKDSFRCREYPCGDNLQPLQGKGWRCTITGDVMDDSD